MRSKNLDCDLSVQASVARTIDLAHAARTQFRLDFIRSEFGASGEGHPLAIIFPSHGKTPGTQMMLCCWTKVYSSSTLMRKFLVPFLIVLLMVYSSFAAFVWRAMRQPPETFARVMAKMPGPVVFLTLPFETLWTHARAGNLQAGDAAPDFSLMKLDKSETVQLSSLTARQPVVLVFGSYT
jgi:hypothetical protein